jgi:hypothetical protein
VKTFVIRIIGSAMAAEVYAKLTAGRTTNDHILSLKPGSLIHDAHLLKLRSQSASVASIDAWLERNGFSGARTQEVRRS